MLYVHIFQKRILHYIDNEILEMMNQVITVEMHVYIQYTWQHVDERDQ